MPRLQWYEFPSLDDKATLSSFIEDVNDKANNQQESCTNGEILYRYPTRKAIKIVEHGNFWVRNFGKKQQVTWDQFQSSFQKEFKTEIPEFYKTDESSQWLFSVIKNEVFKATNMVTKYKYLEIVGEAEHRWNEVIVKATEKYCIKEVFNMYSAVRLTAVENLGMQVIHFCDCMCTSEMY